MSEPMHRRSFLTFLGGTSAAAWPLAAWAQQDGRVRRLGVLAGGNDDSVTRANHSALLEGLSKFGWIEGHNLRIDLRVNLSDPDRIRAHAAELISLMPDVIVTTSRNHA
jgi:putative ABC transport system substrate-binding protein